MAIMSRANSLYSIFEILMRARVDGFPRTLLQGPFSNISAAFSSATGQSELPYSMFGFPTHSPTFIEWVGNYTRF